MVTYGEGTKTLYEDDVSFQWGKNVPPIAKKVVSYPDDMEGVVFRNCTFNFTEKSPNCYVYCVTEKFDEKAMVAFGYDACVRIDNPDMFFRELTRCIEKKHRIVHTLVNSCVYTNRRQQYSQQDSFHPALIKPPRLEYQKEVRAIWTPALDERIAPFFVTCQQLTQYCSKYH